MFEQSVRFGQLFHSKELGKYLSVKATDWSSLAFGPMRKIGLQYCSDKEIWIHGGGCWYHYLAEKPGTLSLTETRQMAWDKPFADWYYYGVAKGPEGELEPYFTKNPPAVTLSDIPDTTSFQIPLTMQKLDYGRVFSYLEPLKALLAPFPACYADRYKRPIKRVRGRTYPVAMEKVQTTWKDLSDDFYPVVVNLSDTPFAVLDLEPEHGQAEEAVFASCPAYYEERTIRGGGHKLIKSPDKQFKYQFSKGLELINESQVTFYGIDGIWLSDKPDSPNLSGFQPVGGSRVITENRLGRVSINRPNVSQTVATLTHKAKERCSTAKSVAKMMFDADTNTSHGEWMALQTLYMQDVAPYKRQLPTDTLPWILEAYAEDVIPWREKHETLRSGLPYLVYLSALISGR